MNEIKLKYKNHSFWTLTGHRHRIMLRSGTSGCTHVAGKCVKRVKMTTLPTPKIWEISDSDNDGDEGAQGDLKGSSCVKFALAPPLSDGCERPSPSKKRRSREELEADKEKARERKDAREKKRAAKVLEREEKRKELQKRKEAAEHVNSLKPENFIKCFTVCIDPVVLQQEGSDILLGTLSSNEWKYRIEQQQLPNSITWTRDLPQGEEGGETVEEDQVVQVLGATEFLDMLISVKTIIDSKGEDSTLCRDAAKVLSVLVTDARSSYKRRGYETVQSKYGGENVNVEEVALGESGAALLCGRLLGQRGPRGEGRLRVETRVEQTDPTAEQSESGCGVLCERRLPVASTAAAGVHSLKLGGGQKEAAGRSGNKGRRKRPADRTGDICQTLSLLHYSEP
ncbi:uncharacterized protein [Nerophis lumbriciformis]|uniref:uncharacterized protein isoform X4 n=1 Tax=Nerophis lumbriciformis TaxID=546530 RepID=UPI002AE06C92|nr:crossover junction endonuclease EME1-like isoform X4 [Nerophis lumbriciformis]